jgi:pimeloyl-ACP methyl ester carboxylesterase
VRLYEALLSGGESSIDTVVAFDYSGFADSGASESAWALSEERVVADLLAVDAWVKASLRPRVLIWWGHSLGTAVALGSLERLADGASDMSLEGGRTDTLPAGLILEAPFTSAVDVAAIDWGGLARRYLRHTFRSMPRAKRRILPGASVLVLHGERDMVVPFAHGRAIAHAAGATLESFDSCHTDIVVRRQQLTRTVGDFVRGLHLQNDASEE